MAESSEDVRSATVRDRRGEPRMRGPVNLRVYGILLRGDKVLVAEETVGNRQVVKYPGGGVGEDETPEAALRREFREECGLDIEIRRLLHAPGTLFSPWTHTNYTPLYYLVTAEGEPRVPDHEPITLTFIDHDTALKSGRMAGPEIFALSRAAGLYA